MVEHIVVDHTSYECQRCHAEFTLDVRVPVFCPACVDPSPYYLVEEWVHGAALVLYRRRTDDVEPVRICVFMDGTANISDELREQAVMVQELLEAVEL